MAATDTLAQPEGEEAEVKRWRFGSAVFDRRTMELRVNDQEVELDRKSLEVLAYLLQHPGELLSKDRLLAAVWPNRILSDTVLAKCISRIRDALGDDDQSLIKTVHGYGYKLVAPVLRESLPPVSAIPVPVSAPPPSTGPGYKSGQWLRRSVLAAGIGALSIAGAFLMVWHPGAQPVTEAAVAVLPFANLGADPAATADFAAGLQESLIVNLSRIRGVKVIARSSTQDLSGGPVNLDEIAEALGVSHAVQGSAQREGDRLLVLAQLVSVPDGKPLWSANYERPLTQLFSIQSELSLGLLTALEAAVSPDERQRIERAPTVSADAWELYLRAADVHRRDQAGRNALQQCEKLLERALEIDPGFALAHALLGRVHLLNHWFAYHPGPERVLRAKAAIDAALQHDGELPEAHQALGLYHSIISQNNAAALREYARALALRPGNPEVYRAIANLRRRQGYWQEALRSLERALELDPRNVGELRNLASLHELLRQFDQADLRYRQAVALAPDDVTLRIIYARMHIRWTGDLEPLRRELAQVPQGYDPDNFVSYSRYTLALLEGRFRDAIALLAAFPGDWLPSGVGANGRSPKALSLAHAHEGLGETSEARGHYLAALQALQDSPEVQAGDPQALATLSEVYVGLGRQEDALSLANRLLQEVPASGDLYRRFPLLMTLAYVRAQAGDVSGALELLEEMLDAPYGETRHSLRLYDWPRRLREDPGFVRMVREPASRH